MNHHHPEFLSSNSAIWNPSVVESFWVYFDVSFWAAAFWLLPSWGVSVMPQAPQPLLLHQGISFLGQQLPGFNRPFPWRHCQTSSSGRESNRYVAPRHVLKLVQPSSGQGEPRSALRPALSGQTRVQDFTRNSKNHIYRLYCINIITEMLCWSIRLPSTCCINMRYSMSTFYIESQSNHNIMTVTLLPEDFWSFHPFSIFTYLVNIFVSFLLG